MTVTLGHLFEVAERVAHERSLLVGVVIAHPPERRRIAVDRGRGRPAGVSHTVDVSGVEVERRTGRALAARMSEPARAEVKAVFDERPCADVDGPRREVVVVVA